MENSDFDPEFSEYNPIFKELSELKELTSKREDEGFLSLMIKKLMAPIYILNE